MSLCVCVCVYMYVYIYIYIYIYRERERERERECVGALGREPVCEKMFKKKNNRLVQNPR